MDDLDTDWEDRRKKWSTGGRTREIAQSKQQRENKLKRKSLGVRGATTTKRSDVYVIRVPEGRGERGQG